MTPKPPLTLLRKFQLLTLGEAFALAEGLTLMAVAAVAIQVLPFPVLGKIAARPIRRPLTDPDKRRVTLDMVVWAVEVTARRSRLRALCFEQGLTTQWMMRRRGIDSTLYWGAAPGDKDKPLKAHVWVMADGLDVAGGEIAHQYAVLAKFPSDAVAGELSAQR